MPLTGKAGWQRKFEDRYRFPTDESSSRFVTPPATSPAYRKRNPTCGMADGNRVLMLVSRSGPTMMARIGLMKALNRHVERVFNPDRKDTHWGNGS